MWNSAIDWIRQFLTENHFASGGLMLAAITWIGYSARTIPSRIYDFIKRRMLFEYELLNYDDAFGWMLAWLGKQPCMKRARRFTVLSCINGDDDDDYTPRSSVGERRCCHPKLHFVPGQGVHFVCYKRHWLMIQRVREEKSSAGSDGRASLLYRESLIITGPLWSKAIIAEMIEQARADAMPKDDRIMVRIAQYGDWVNAGSTSGRPIESVILDSGTMQKLVDDVDLFRERKSWYHDRGIPWRRGYLLEGEPGNGKSSAIRAIATHLRMNIGVINLGDDEMTDDRLLGLMNRINDATIVVIEDIDCAYRDREAAQVSKRLTFSGLLNAIDGVASGDGRIFFMTTNHPDKLDAALIRPGRVDMRVHIGNATPDQAGRLYDRFHPNGSKEDREAFMATARAGDVSMAALQGKMMESSFGNLV